MLRFEKQIQKSFRNRFRESLNLIDAFGQPAPINVLNNDKYSTKLGQVITILLLLVCGIELGYAFSAALNYSNPSILTKQALHFDTSPITLLPGNFTLAFSFLDINFGATTDFWTYFTPIVQNSGIIRTTDAINGTLNIRKFHNNYDLEPCSMEKHFPTEIQKQSFAQKNISQAYCINSEQWKKNPPVIQGTYQSSTYQYLTLTVIPCKNTSTYNKCPPLEAIHNYVSGMYYLYDRNDILSQLDNFSVPFQTFIKPNVVPISMNQSQIIQENLATSQVFTDVGLVLSDYQYTDSIGIGNTIVSPNAFNNQYIMLHYIQFADTINIYHRNYQKLQALLGQIGGLWQVMYFVSQIMISPVVIKFMNLQIAKKLFDFETDPDQNQATNQKWIQSSIFKTKLIDMNMDFTNRDTISKFIKSRKKTFVLTLKYVGQLVLGCRKDENIQLQYAAQKIYSKLDVSFILQKLIEIDKLKQVLLTKDQCQLFNYLPKPIIPIQLFDKDKRKLLEDNPLYEIILSEEQTDEYKFYKAYEIYTTMSQKSQNPIDMKLIKLLDTDIIKLFKSIESNQGNMDLSPGLPQIELFRVEGNNQQDQVELNPIMSQDSLQRQR